MKPTSEERLATIGKYHRSNTNNRELDWGFILSMQAAFFLSLPGVERKMFNEQEGIDSKQLDMYDMVYPGKLHYYAAAMRAGLPEYVEQVVYNFNISTMDFQTELEQVRYNVINNPKRKLSW